MQTTLFQPPKPKEKHSHYIPTFIGYFTVDGPIKEESERLFK